MTKSLKDISWDVSEDTYRADKALSYSTLAKYEREGFNGLSKLFEPIHTAYLTFGSAVDSIITGGQEEFNERFFVADFPSISDTIINIVTTLFKTTRKDSLNSIDDKTILEVADINNYGATWKPETRIRLVKEKGAEYYELLHLSENKTILNTTTYTEVQQAVNALKTSEATKQFFTNDNPFDGIERCYQLKFKATLEGINYRCMADLIYIDHNNKKIIPIDLKTSSHYEWDFYKSFIEWMYHIQARLYWRIIKHNIMKDSYFRNFTLEPYLFVVVNRKSLTPQVWRFPSTSYVGNIIVGKNSQIIMRDPFEIGKELNHYLTSNPTVPIGINKDGINNLNEWLNKI